MFDLFISFFESLVYLSLSPLTVAITTLYTTPIDILVEGLPPDLQSTRTPQPSQTTSKYPVVPLTLDSFEQLASIPRATKVADSVLWHISDKAGGLSYNRENEVSTFVSHALDDIILACGMDIDVERERSLDTLVPDVWVLTLHKIPLAVIEVKKPCLIDESQSQLPLSAYHQLNQYLVMLHNTHGVQTPFGILTTYTHWIICWLDNGNKIAKATDLNVIRNIKSFAQPGTKYVLDSFFYSRHVMILLFLVCFP